LKTIEKRKHPRVETNKGISYLLKDDDGNRIKEGTGRTINISQGGILIETDTPFTWQDILQMSIDVEGELVTISGKVVYCNTVDSEIFRTGIEFLKTNEKILSFVIGLLKTYL
jgi:Tfp pilus assembly protein PilZ